MTSGAVSSAQHLSVSGADAPFSGPTAEKRDKRARSKKLYKKKSIGTLKVRAPGSGGQTTYSEAAVRKKSRYPRCGRDNPTIRGMGDITTICFALHIFEWSITFSPLSQC